MKKIVTLFAAAFAAMSMSAAITDMTCAQAYSAALALQSGETGTDTVSIVGYVTNTNGTVSRGQQSFWMDDEPGTTKTFQSYWGNLPADDQTPLNVGDKVKIVGFLMNYGGTTAEMKNGDVTIIQRVSVVRDTTVVDVCDAIAIGEALNSGDVSDDYYDVTGVVTMAAAGNDTYHTQTIDLTCEADNKILEGYNITLQGDDYAAVGDTVRFLGRLTNYNNTKIEFNGGKAWIVGKNANQYEPQIINATVAEAVAAGMELNNGALSLDTFIVTGFVDSIATVYSEQYNNISFFMCDNMANPTYNFEAYRVKGGADLKVGDKVAVKSVLQHYYKAATEDKAEINLIETVSGATYELLPTSALDNVETAAAEKFIQDGQLYIRKNGVVYTILGAQK
ncbi:MAG: hypothetical protein KBS77_01925 [Bacteroidales bacterium]|nr:hypothetical protein [Candidatus Colicola faecequi]